MTFPSAGESVETAARLHSAVVPRRSGLSRKHREWLAAALFLLPDALGLFVFLGIPMILALSLGFFEVSGFGDYTWIGLDNYRQMFKDPLFTKSLKVTATYVLIQPRPISPGSVEGFPPPPWCPSRAPITSSSASYSR